VLITVDLCWFCCD